MWRKYLNTLSAVLALLCIPYQANAQDGAIELPGIVVTASPLETPEDRTFSPVTVLNEEDLEAGLSRSLALLSN